MTSLYLCQVNELDTNYENVVNFKSKETRRRWFLGKQLETVEWNGKADDMRTSITLNIPFDSLIEKCDYLFFNGHDDKEYFYFINSVEYNTPSSVNVEVELDVFTTFQFDFELQHSFVERCHVDRWKNGLPTNEVVDEGFSNYDYVLKERELVAKTSNTYIITSTEPLGIIEPTLSDGVTGGEGSNEGSGGEGGGADLNEFPETKKIYNSYGTWLIPCVGKVTAVYGNYTGHTGIDIAWSKGTSIVASRDGVVKTIKTVDDLGTSKPNYGKYVVLEHNDGLTTLYGHCDTVTVEVGQTVFVGEQIAKMGNTGYVISTGGDGTHLHFEIRRNNSAFDPDPHRKLRIGDYVEMNRNGVK